MARPMSRLGTTGEPFSLAMTTVTASAQSFRRSLRRRSAGQTSTRDLIRAVSKRSVEFDVHLCGNADPTTDSWYAPPRPSIAGCFSPRLVKLHARGNGQLRVAESRRCTERTESARLLERRSSKQCLSGNACAYGRRFRDVLSDCRQRVDGRRRARRQIDRPTVSQSALLNTPVKQPGHEEPCLKMRVDLVRVTTKIASFRCRRLESATANAIDVPALRDEPDAEPCRVSSRERICERRMHCTQTATMPHRPANLSDERLAGRDCLQCCRLDDGRSE